MEGKTKVGERERKKRGEEEGKMGGREWKEVEGCRREGKNGREEEECRK